MSGPLGAWIETIWGILDEGPPAYRLPLTAHHHAVKLVPHPQPPVALGLLNAKPLPCIEVT